MHGGQIRSRFYSDELKISNRLPGEGLWWSEKAQKGTKFMKSKQSPSSLLDGGRLWLKQTHRDSPRHHIQRVCPEISMVWGVQGLVVYTGMAVCNHCSLCGQRQNIFSSGTAANFALIAQGTLWTANSHWEAGEAPERACWSSTVLLSTPRAVSRLAGGKLTKVQWLLRRGTVQMSWVYMW